MWNHPLYITQAQLYKWCEEKSRLGPVEYSTALTLYENAAKTIAAFFDGSLGTFRNPMTGETQSYPEICSYQDVMGFFAQEFGLKSIGVSNYNPCGDKDEQFWTILNQWKGRIERFCKFNKKTYLRLLQLSAIDYNPLADFWKKDTETQGHAPYASLQNNQDRPRVSDWTLTNNNKDYSSTTSTTGNGIENKHQTTTYDSATFRDESKDIQTGGTTTTNNIPNSADFKTFDEEGNDATPMQDIIMKEFDIAHLWNIFELFMNDLSKEIYLSVWNV